MTKPQCAWCRNPNADDTDRPDLLCRTHLAEYEGLSVAELDRMESEQACDML